MTRGVDNIDSVTLPEGCGRSGGDCDTSLLLLSHPVHRSSTIVSFTDLVVYTSIEQDTLGGGCLTCVDVRHDTNITGHFERYVSFHKFLRNSGITRGFAPG